MRPSSSLPGMCTPRSQIRFWSSSSSFRPTQGIAAGGGGWGTRGGGSCRSTAFILAQRGKPEARSQKLEFRILGFQKCTSDAPTTGILDSDFWILAFRAETLLPLAARVVFARPDRAAAPGRSPLRRARSWRGESRTEMATPGALWPNGGRRTGPNRPSVCPEFRRSSSFEQRVLAEYGPG